MPEIADMFHPVDSPRKHLLTTRNPNRRNGIPEISSISVKVSIQVIAITYQAPTKWTRTSLYENVSLKRSAMDIFSSVPDDPTRVTVGISLFGSEYSSYALNMIN
jgi:hypothetical protein